MTPAEIRQQVAASRRAQNLPDTVEDATFLTLLATNLLSREEVGPDAA